MFHGTLWNFDAARRVSRVDNYPGCYHACYLYCHGDAVALGIDTVCG